MKKSVISICLALILLMSTLTGCAKKAKFNGNMSDVTIEPGDTYVIITVKDYGEIKAKLFPEAAPEAVKKFTEAATAGKDGKGYYDGKTIHRVLAGMLIQGGALNLDGSDPSIPTAEYFPVETSPRLRNFYGALCFANVPDKGNYRQFYIVTANTPADIDKDAADFKAVIDKNDKLTKDAKKTLNDEYKAMTKFPADVKERYKERGGLYRLDGTTTVFGQVVSGFDILEKIQEAEVVAGNKIDDDNAALGKYSRPLNEIFIEKIEVVVFEAEPEVTEKAKSKKKK